MPIFRKADKRVAFIHIPKAAGSSVERHFTGNGWEMDFYRPCSHPSEPALHHLTYEGLGELVPDLDDCPSFCIVRNPYKRMVSEWRWHRTRMRTTRLDFNDFVRRVRVSLGTSRTYYDNHWRPQSDFVDDRLSSVIRIERLNEGFGEFVERHDLGFTEPIPRLGTSKLGKLPRLRMRDGILDEVLELYRADFERFGYPTDPPELT